MEKWEEEGVFHLKQNQFENLKGLREEANLTIREFADIVGKSKSQCSRWETGEQIIPLIYLNFICNYFNVSMDYVFGFSKMKYFKPKYSTLKIDVIAQRIKQFRTDKRLTQVKLAKFLNTTHSTISQYENKHSLILTSFVYQICKKYKISADWLCGRI